MIYFRIYDTDAGNMIAMCDGDLIGNVYKEGKIELDLNKYSGFYKGDELNEEQFRKTFDKSSLHSANIVGKQSVALLIELGAVSENDVMHVDGVPFVQLFSVK